MDAVLLSRIQFALTIGFHFIYAPLGIGLSWLIVALLGRYRKSGAAEDKAAARFWVTIFSLSFAVGVATGIVNEFQFGTNWAQYSRFVGDIFGAPLAAEGIFAFFLESVFVGLLLFGWERVSRNTLYTAGLLVAIGATLSAFWILIANSWMQTPAGFTLLHGRAELTDFWAAVVNHSTLERVLHTVDAALLTGAMFMGGISAWFLLNNRHVEAMRRTLNLSVWAAVITALLQLGSGHLHAVEVSYHQPAKLAAFEGLFDTQHGAPLLLFGIPDQSTATVHYAIRVPHGLSLIARFDPNAELQGLNDFPRDEWPPILLTFVPFHLMFLLGMFFIAYPLLGLLLLWRRKLHSYRPYLWGVLLVTPLPFIANELGWMCAEVGRQPWIVYHVLRTRDAISISVPAVQILASIVLLTGIYAFLFIVWLLVLRRALARGLGEGSAEARV